MRRAWSTIFLLCMACMICMSGLCLAADDGIWVEYFRLDGYELHSVNPSSIKCHEWGGRKFLEANVRRDLINSNLGKGRIDNVIVIDIQNRKYIYLESGEWKDGKYLKFQSSSISEIVNGEELRSPSKYDVLVKWVEKNRPDVINEIHTHNQTAPSLEALKNVPPENPTPGAQAQPEGNEDVTGKPNNSGDLHSLIYTPLKSEKAVLAFCPLDSEGDISEIYLNPYKSGQEYIIISTFPYERGRGYYHHFSTFTYTPDDPDDPGAGGEFLFTGGDGGYLNVYSMRARIIDETTLKIEWVTGKDAPQPRQPSEYLPYPEDIYELQHLTQDQADNYRKVPYRFISKHGHFPRYCNQEFSTMFAVLDYLKEGNTLEAITEPPQGMAIPGEDEDFKQPGKYRKPKTDVA